MASRATTEGKARGDGAKDEQLSFSWTAAAGEETTGDPSVEIFSKANEKVVEDDNAVM